MRLATPLDATVSARARSSCGGPRPASPAAPRRRKSRREKGRHSSTGRVRGRSGSWVRGTEGRCGVGDRRSGRSATVGNPTRGANRRQQAAEGGVHSRSCAGYASGSRHQAAMLIQNSLHSGPSAMARVGSAGTRPEPNNYGSNRLGGSEAQLAACRVSMRGEPRRGGAGALATGRVARAAVEWVQGAVARPCRRGDAHLRQLGTEYLTLVPK